MWGTLWNVKHAGTVHTDLVAQVWHIQVLKFNTLVVSNFCLLKGEL